MPPNGGENPKPKPTERGLEQSRLKAEIEYRKKLLEKGGTEETRKREEKLLLQAERTLAKFEEGKERKPGFAKLPEKSGEAELLDFLSTEEKLELFRELIEERPLTEKQERSLLELRFLHTLSHELVKILSFAKRIEVILPNLDWKVKTWFEENVSELSTKILVDENFDLRNAIPQNIRRILQQHSGFDVEALHTKEDIYHAYENLLERLRGEKDYETSQAIMEDLLEEEFEKGSGKLGKKWIDQIKAEVGRGKVFRLYVENQEKWRESGMSEEQIQEYYTNLVKLEEEREIRKKVSEHILGEKIKIPPEKEKIWAQYRDMLDPKHEWFEISDEMWDSALREIAINAPLIVLSGGIASLARAGLGKMAIRILQRQGERFIGTALRAGSPLSRGIVALARKGGGLLVEGAVFDMTHHALTLEQYHSIPEWAQSIIWSSATLGAFHKAGKLSERFFAKKIGNLPVPTWLGEQASKITNSKLREVVKTLAVKGHIEAATMLLIGAAQHKGYNGNLDEFFENIGDEILHAYITVGALKISGKVIKPWMNKLVKPPEEVMELDRDTRSQLSGEFTDKKTSEEMKRRILDALLEHYPEEVFLDRYPHYYKHLTNQQLEFFIRRVSRGAVHLSNEMFSTFYRDTGTTEMIAKFIDAIVSAYPFSVVKNVIGSSLSHPDYWPKLKPENKNKLVSQLLEGTIDLRIAELKTHDETFFLTGLIEKIIQDSSVASENKLALIELLIEKSPAYLFANPHIFWEHAFPDQRLKLIEKIASEDVDASNVRLDMFGYYEHREIPASLREKARDGVIRNFSRQILAEKKAYAFRGLAFAEKLKIIEKCIDSEMELSEEALEEIDTFFYPAQVWEEVPPKELKIRFYEFILGKNPNFFVKAQYTWPRLERLKNFLIDSDISAGIRYGVFKLVMEMGLSLNVMRSLCPNILKNLKDAELVKKYADIIIQSYPEGVFGEKEDLTFVYELDPGQKDILRMKMLERGETCFLLLRHSNRLPLSSEERRLALEKAAVENGQAMIGAFDLICQSDIERRIVIEKILQSQPVVFWGATHIWKYMPEISPAIAKDIILWFKKGNPDRFAQTKISPEFVKNFAEAYKKILRLYSSLTPEEQRKHGKVFGIEKLLEAIALSPKLADAIVEMSKRAPLLFKDTNLFRWVLEHDLVIDGSDIEFFNTLIGRYSSLAPDIVSTYKNCLDQKVISREEKGIVLELLEQIRILTPKVLEGYKKAKASGTTEIFITYFKAFTERISSQKPLTEAERKVPYYQDLIQYVYQNNSGQWTNFEHNDSASDRSHDIAKYRLRDRYVLDLRAAQELRVKEGQKIDEQGIERLKKEIPDIQLELRDTNFEPKKMQEYFEKRLQAEIEKANIPNETMEQAKTTEEKLFLLTLDAMVNGKNIGPIKRLMLLFQFSHFQDIRDYIQGTTDRVSRARNPDYALMTELHNFYADQIKEVFRKIVQQAQENPALQELLPQYFEALQKQRAGAERAERIARLQVSKLGLTDQFVDQLRKVIKQQTERDYSKEQMRRIIHLYEVVARGLQEKTTPSRRGVTRAFYGQLRGQRQRTFEALREITGQEFDPSRIHLGEINLEQLLETEAGIIVGEYNEALFVTYLQQKFLEIFGKEVQLIEQEVTKFEAVGTARRGGTLHAYITKTKESAHARQVGGVCVAGDNPLKARSVQGPNEGKNMWDMENYFQLVFVDPETNRSQGLVLLHEFTDSTGKKILTASLNPSSTYLYSVDEKALFDQIMKTLEEFAMENDFDTILFSQNKTVRTNRTGGEFERAIDERMLRVGRTYRFETPQRFSYSPSYELQDMDVVWERP